MLKNLLLALLGVAAALLAAEGACHLVDRIRCLESPGISWEPDRFSGWRHTAGAAGWAQRCLRGKPEWRVYTRINSLGLRDREIPYDRRAGFRILVLGDSFTEAIQVEAEEVYTRLLEDRLNVGAPGRFEVVNAGVAGYGTDNALLFYRHEGWKYHADLVLLAFNAGMSGADVLENHTPLMRATLPYPDKPYFALEDGHLRLQHFPLPLEPLPLRLLGRCQRALARRSALYRLLGSLGAPRVPVAQADVGYFATGLGLLEFYLAEPPAPWREAWRITRGLILMLRREVEAHGSRFAVVVLNGKEEVSERRWQWTLYVDPKRRAYRWDRDRPNRLITGFLARRGIPAIPLLEPFRAYFRRTGLSGFYEWDVHWAPAGHELAAEAIHRGLFDLGLVSAAGAR